VSSSHLPLFPPFLDSTIEVNKVVPETVKASWVKEGKRENRG
jgi:hypothetical protein